MQKTYYLNLFSEICAGNILGRREVCYLILRGDEHSCLDMSQMFDKTVLQASCLSIIKTSSDVEKGDRSIQNKNIIITQAWKVRLDLDRLISDILAL